MELIAVTYRLTTDNELFPQKNSPMQKVILVLFFVCFIIHPLFAQKSELRSSKDSIKYFKKHRNKGELLFEKMDYKLAITHLQKANRIKKDQQDVNTILGICYLYSEKPDSAVLYLKKAISLRTDINPELYYYLGNAYQNNYQFAKAKEFYKKYLPETDSTTSISIERYIEECENGLKLIKDTARVEIMNLGDSVNSFWDDYAAYLFPSDTLMAFTSKREENMGGFINPYDGQYYEDIYFASRNSKGFFNIRNAGRPVNSQNPDAVVGISGNDLIIYLYADVNEGDIFASHYTDNQWQDPLYVDAVNSQFQETGLSSTPNDKYIYFVSNRTGSLGGKDIFMIEKHDSTYKQAINLGENINTSYDEEAIHICPGNDTLYFSSKGHNSMGGFDIFRSVKDEKGVWLKPENMGFPINTPYDDMYFRPVSDSVFYYSSTHADTRGKSDIYKVVYLPEIKEEEIIALNPKDIFKDINDYLIIHTLSFEYDKHENPDKLPKLDSLADFMNEHSDFNLQITGYTDTIGKTWYNNQLAEKRANYVYEYLINQGVSKNQLTKKTGGETNQIAESKEQGIQAYFDAIKYNRRVTFKVLSNGYYTEVYPQKVPEKYHTKNTPLQPQLTGKNFSIMLTSSTEKRNLSDFELSQVNEINYKNNFFYHSGKFTRLKEAEKALDTISTTYPDAFIFELTDIKKD